MKLSPEAIHKFKDIYQQEFGEELSNAKAEEHALRVLRIFQIILRPLQDDLERSQPEHVDRSLSFDTMEP